MIYFKGATIGDEKSIKTRSNISPCHTSAQHLRAETIEGIVTFLARININIISHKIQFPTEVSKNQFNLLNILLFFIG